MRRLFFYTMTLVLAAGIAACSKEKTPQDNTVYGNIEVINASDATIAIGRIALSGGLIAFKKDLSEEGYQHYLDSLDRRGEDLELDFVGSLGFQMESSTCGGYKVYTFGSGDYDMIILYIHGGGYANNAISNHFTMCNDIASRDGRIKVVLPIYPLTPQHTWKDTYNLVDELYSELLKEGKPIVIMGDSAGGGFTCAYTQYLHKTGKPLPSKRVLISPWLDVTYSDAAAEDIEPRDAMLCIYGLRKLGQIWKGELDAKDYRISPLFGDLDDGIPTLITVGTNEIMLPDCNTLYNRLVANRCRTELIYGIGLWHIFPVFDVPESIEVREKIIDFMRK